MKSRFSLQQQIFFFKRLAFLLGAGVPLLESLAMLREQAARRQIKMYDSILGDIAEGRTFSRACGKYPKAFTPFSLSIVQVGEQTGTLAQNLAYLAEELQQAQALRRKIVSAFIYPALIACATLGIAAFLVLYLFPKIIPVFVALHAQLPLTTRIVMAISLFLQHWWLVCIFAVCALILGCAIALRRSVLVQALLDRITLHLPLVGTMLCHYHLSQSCRTLGLLLKSGVRLSDALPITAEATRNQIYKAQFQALTSVVERGERMSTYVEKRPSFFPPLFSHMVAVGERSGTLAETLLYLAQSYDREVDEFTKNLTVLVEPLLMIGMGLIVGFIALAIITPIYGITQNLHA